jgi:hypothetical protein
MGEGSGTAREISLGDDFGDVVVKANGAQVKIGADGTIQGFPAPANDGLSDPPAANAAYRLLSAKAAHEIGAIESTGEHKGEIYGGIWSKEYGGDNKPIWFSTAPRLMDHYDAAAWAEGQGGSVPTRKQGDYLTTLKGKGGAFTELFNRGTSFPGGYIWLAEPNTFNRDDAWCQRLSDGDQFNRSGRYNDLPVLSVRR